MGIIALRSSTMCDEPEPMRQIHEIRAKMVKEFEELSIREIGKRVAEGARIEREHIFGNAGLTEAVCVDKNTENSSASTE